MLVRMEIFNRKYIDILGSIFLLSVDRTEDELRELIINVKSGLGDSKGPFCVHVHLCHGNSMCVATGQANYDTAPAHETQV